ncbi:hypothetical protein JNB_14418 [Janibacter sp. HTCC2649]|uniref:hypothetical protein n=1 Tax=Janibacter sp. HTCC2649 TaxID=313589 RepID=UPI00006719EC|nr:hypothetical protein [Janibacter sp. HTCC2649]EAP98166.1 hypothetical protein JNB_14418 [Janibacter sp. HTCC2649]
MNPSFITPEAVHAEMLARYGQFTQTHERPGSSLHVIRRVRARVQAARNAR